MRMGERERGGLKGKSEQLSCSHSCNVYSFPVECNTVDLDKPKLVAKPVKELRVLDPKSAQNICKLCHTVGLSVRIIEIDCQ